MTRRHVSRRRDRQRFGRGNALNLSLCEAPDFVREAVEHAQGARWAADYAVGEYVATEAAWLASPAGDGPTYPTPLHDAEAETMRLCSESRRLSKAAVRILRHDGIDAWRANLDRDRTGRHDAILEWLPRAEYALHRRLRLPTMGICEHPEADTITTITTTDSAADADSSGAVAHAGTAP